MKHILTDIASHKKEEVAGLKLSHPLERVMNEINNDDLIDFKNAISRTGQINIIAEIKKASPSKGILIKDFNPAALALKYKAGGASALSVLTDEKYFQGAFHNIEQAKKNAGLPILCKEFIVDPYQIYYARLMKADSVLLIVKLLDRKQLSEFIRIAGDNGMHSVVEVHNETEAKIAVDAGAEIIGVNNRNLEDFSVSLEVSESLAPSIPNSVVKVAESGIFNQSDIKRLKQAGYNAFLIGEALVKSADPIELLNSLRAA
jgi:indole-3-glycerol phosphate synthase